jgi:outer membrane protein OmpA-like peptidoglycan-associated protein
MKEFSDYEKKILNNLLELDETPASLVVLGNALDFEFHPHYHISLKSPTDCPLIISKEHLDHTLNTYGNAGVNELIKQLNNKLFYIVKLFQYLESESQVHFSEELDIPFVGNNSIIYENDNQVGYQIGDKEVVELLYKFFRKKIVLAESLKQFIKSDFKTKSDLLQEKKDRDIERNFRIAKYGILATLILGLVSNIPKFIELTKDNTTKIEIVNEKIKVDTECCDSEKSELTNPLYDNLYFEFDSIGILPASQFHIETICHILNSKPKLSLEIIGNCDSVGTKLYNEELSEDRALKVADEFTKRGILLSRIKIISLGESSPISNSIKYYGRWKNRRVELRLK